MEFLKDLMPFLTVPITLGTVDAVGLFRLVCSTKLAARLGFKMPCVNLVRVRSNRGTRGFNRCRIHNAITYIWT